MALTDRRGTLVRGVLQNASVMYKNPSFVADQLFPIIDGLDPLTKITKERKGPWFRDEAQPRNAGTASRVVERAIHSQNLDPVNYGLASFVTKEERRDNARNRGLVNAPDIKAIMLTANGLDIKKEVRAAAVLWATNWSAAGAGGVDAAGGWGHDTASSDTFLADMRTGRETIYNNTGIVPNTLFLDFYAFSAIQVAPALLALMNPQKLTKDALVTLDALAALAQVKNVVIGSAIKSTAEQTYGQDDFTASPIWGQSSNPTKGCGFLYYKPDAPGIDTPSAGYQYRVLQENGQGRETYTWYEDKTYSTYYDTNEECDIAAVSTDCGYLWYDTALT